MNKDNFIESYSDFNKSYEISEAESQAEDNQKIKDLMEKAKDAKDKAIQFKNSYEELVKEKKDSEAEIALLNYKKYKATAELSATEAKLLKKGIKNNEF